MSGHTVALEDGTEVRLVSVLSPQSGRSGNKGGSRDHGQLAFQALSDLLMGQEVALGVSGRRTDRYGRRLAHLYLLRDGERLWVQRILVERGLARVASFADGRACVRLLLGYENTARVKRRGLWRNPAYRVRDALRPEALLSGLYQFQIVEGVVHKVAEVKGRVFLNFEEDWHTDFTATIARKDRKIFRKEGFDFADLEGRKVRVRGWIERWNGPVIKVTHPEQIEVAGGDGSGAVSGKKKNPPNEIPADLSGY